MAIMVTLMGLAVAVFSYAASFPTSSHLRSGKWMPGPAFFPQMLAAALFVAALVELYKAWSRRRASRAQASDGAETPYPPLIQRVRARMGDWGTQNAIIILAMMVAFSLLVERVGFSIMGFATVFIITWRLKAGLVQSAVFAAVGVVATVLFFRYVFYMDLPFGIWSPAQHLGY